MGTTAYAVVSLRLCGFYRLCRYVLTYAVFVAQGRSEGVLVNTPLSSKASFGVLNDRLEVLFRATVLNATVAFPHFFRVQTVEIGRVGGLFRVFCHRFDVFNSGLLPC
jgi:hypothetical protein